MPTIPPWDLFRIGQEFRNPYWTHGPMILSHLWMPNFPSSWPSLPFRTFRILYPRGRGWSFPPAGQELGFWPWQTGRPENSIGTTAWPDGRPRLATHDGSPSIQRRSQGGSFILRHFLGLQSIQFMADLSYKWNITYSGLSKKSWETAKKTTTPSRWLMIIIPVSPWNILSCHKLRSNPPFADIPKLDVVEYDICPLNLTKSR